MRLIHWDAAEARDRAAILREAGYVVDAAPLTPEGLKRLRVRPPNAVVIDLSRIPSRGRDLGAHLRVQGTTRRVPLVFVGGDREKVAATRALLPDATYASWDRVVGALKRALASRPEDPVVPSSSMAGYSGTPLPRKLGIKPGHVLALVSAPSDFEATLGVLPEAVSIRRRATDGADLTIWFTRSRRDLEGRIADMAGRVGDGGLWIAWPKGASGVKTDISGNDVRRVGLASGLVDYKVCAIDETWSGLKFARRKRAKGK